MKGILGRKVGMTQVYSDHGVSIPVTVIEVQPNVVTSVLTEKTNGYNAIQLGLEDLRKSRQTKPRLGHFSKASTTPKRFVKEIRGMEGYTLGAIVDASIFQPGELVDVTGTSKGHGFSGTIKRHNQSIGPKSHGGGGGSQPVRQTGSLGDISGNKVVKGMTMPGHFGHVKTTIQNLEVISVDLENNVLLVRGSIPGPRKSYVIVKEAVKGLPSKEAFVMVDLAEAQRKNELVEEAKHLNVVVNTDMELKEMEQIVNDAKLAKEQALKDEKAKNASLEVKEEVKSETKEEAKPEIKVEQTEGSN